jgi:SAM-dependent methyltransferase
VRAEEILANVNEKNVATTWDDAHHYSPAPRHRRRLIMKALRGIQFSDCLDAGCAQPFLIEEIAQRFNVKGYGCDISDQVMAAARQSHPAMEFQALDLTAERWPGDKQFDLVVCSEVLEHIPEWRLALANLVKMTRKHLLITVPGGKIRIMDKMVGHHQHFSGAELREELNKHDFDVQYVRRWGFPMHSMYKSSISMLSPDKLYDSFAGGKYGTGQKLISNMIYGTFFLNDLFGGGEQVLCMSHRKGTSQ